MTGDEHYLEDAKRAFMVDYDNGDVASYEGRDSVFLQLLAKPGLQKIYVILGHTDSFHSSRNTMNTRTTIGRLSCLARG